MSIRYFVTSSILHELPGGAPSATLLAGENRQGHFAHAADNGNLPEPDEEDLDDEDDEDEDDDEAAGDGEEDEVAVDDDDDEEEDDDEDDEDDDQPEGDEGV